MIRRVLISAALLLTAAANAETLGNHELPEDKAAHNARVALIRDSHPIIALQPLTLPTIDEAEAVKAEFHGLLQQELEANGFQVVPAEVFAEQWQARLEAVGGIYDAITGVRDDAKYEAALTDVRAGLAESHGASAFLVADILPRDVTFNGGNAKFGGVKEKANVKGGRAMFGTTVPVGILRAAMLEAELFDASGESLYANMAGIQLLSKMGREGTVGLDPDEFLRTGAYNKAAVSLALRAMLLDHAALSKNIQSTKRKKARK